MWRVGQEINGGSVGLEGGDKHRTDIELGS
jgi:hypothetical protein